MRVASSSSAALVLEHKPWVVPALVASCVVAVIAQTANSPSSLSFSEWIGTAAGVSVGGAIAYLAALPSRVIFDATAGQVTWNHMGWPGRLQGSCPLSEVTGVELLAEESGAKRLALCTSSGLVPLTRHYTGFERHEQSATAIREWLAQYTAGPPAP